MAVFGALPLVASGLMPGAQSQPKHGAFDRGGIGNIIAGSLADAIANSTGAQGMYAPQLAMRRQQDYEQQQYDRRLKDQRDSWIAQQQYKIAHPAPTSLQSDYAFLSGMDPKLGQQFIQNKADPIQAVPSYDPNTGQQGLRFIRPSQMSGARPQRPAIGTVVDQLPGASAGASDAQGGAILNGGAQTGVITAAQAAQIRDSLGPNGQAAFQQWMMQNHIRIAQ